MKNIYLFSLALAGMLMMAMTASAQYITEASAGGFDFSQGKDYVVIYAPDDQVTAMGSKIASNQNLDPNQVKNQFFYWVADWDATQFTLYDIEDTQKNSWGGTSKLNMTPLYDWGAGHFGAKSQAYDLTSITNDYVLHIGFMNIGASDATKYFKFSFGPNGNEIRLVVNRPVGQQAGELTGVGNAPDVNKWYYLDIPIKDLLDPNGNFGFECDFSKPTGKIIFNVGFDAATSSAFTAGSVDPDTGMKTVSITEKGSALAIDGVFLYKKGSSDVEPTPSPDEEDGKAIEGAPAGYRLVWSDEFNGTSLDEKAWTIEVSGSGGGNQELQYYRKENVSVTDGNLVLTAKRESYQGKSFTSGRINSNQKSAFKHGIMQAKVKFPKTANGLWPAYWMMGNDINKYGWPRCGEIDIVEMGHFNAISGAYAGWQDRYFSGTLHYGPDATNEHHQQNSQEFSKEKFETIGVVEDDYHIFTIEWDGDYLYMYYDLEGYTNARKNKARYFSQAISYSDNNMAPGHYFQKPFYFLFNLAVGGTFTDIYDPAKITALPNVGDEAKMYVDWVRVYQKEDDTDAQYLFTNADGQKLTNIPEEPEQPSQDDNMTELSGFATEALDANGVSTFDFSDVSDAVLISTSDGVTGHLLDAGVAVKDLNVNNENRNLYIWENTYVPVTREGKTNSFGWDEGYNMFTVASVGWSGLGFNIKNEDLSQIDDTYWLHFAMKGDDPEKHTSHQITVSNANFIVGNSDGKLASVGDFKRDGKWYYFDIPVKVLKQFANPLFKGDATNFDDNIIALMSGGVTDSELSFDNIFFYKSKTKEIPTYADTKTDLGKYGYKSVTEQGTWAFDLEQVGIMIPLQLSDDVWNGVTSEGTYGDGSLVNESHDYTQNNNYYPWEGTVVGNLIDNAANSSGVFTGGITAWASTAVQSWNGMGIASAVEKDLSMIDDSYYLHIALRSDAAVGHIPVRVRFGAESSDAILTFGAYSTHPIFADFPRDGEWYAFDIPVAELKKYGKLWGKNGNGKVGEGENLLCFYTMDTNYNGSGFSFDNVFFWTKKDGSKPEVNVLGDYTVKSLNAAGESYFSLENKEFVNFNVSEATLSMQTEGGTKEENVIAGYYTLNNWEGNTYSNGDKSGTVVNSLGIEGQDWIDWVVATSGWSGGGFLAEDGADLTVLEDGDWYLHFSMRGTDECNHLVGFAESRFTIGSEPFDENSPVIGNYQRNGEWYSFDIPYSAIKQSFPNLYPQNNGGQAAWKGNLVWFMSGGHTGDELQMDNVFFWREKKATPEPEPDGIENVHQSEGPGVAAPYADAVYNLQGSRVARLSDVKARMVTLPRGIYIVNGKKVVIR